jgi:glycosyltransferase involved in cell wall biosynthesis
MTVHGQVPTLSVIIVSPAGAWRHTVDSVSRQTLSPTEIIVVTRDGGGDCDDPRVRLVTTASVGTPPGPEMGVAAAAGDYVGVLSDDDHVVPAWLERLVAATERGRIDLVRCGVLRIGADGLVDGVEFPARGDCDPDRLPTGTYLARRRLLRQSHIWPVSAVLNQLLVCKRAAGYPPAEVPRRPPDHRPRLVSVILPVRNGAPILPMQLRALAGQGYPGAWELVVVDNGSSDATPAVVTAVADRFSRLQLIDASDRVGESYARNAGIAAARGDFLAFCDADDIADAGWLEGMVTAAGGADMVGGALDVSMLSPRCADEQPVPMPEQPDFLPFARGANCGLWRDVAVTVGGWSEHYLGGGEDMDLSWRVQLCGFRLAYAPDARMHYRLRSRLRPLARQKWRYGKSGARLYRAHRQAGLRRRTGRQVVGSWLWLLVHVPDLARSAGARRRWVRFAARLAGFAYGSIQQRVAYL